MFKYYVDVEIDFKNIAVSKKNEVIEFLFNTFHGILRSDKYKVGLSFPKFSASKDDKFPTLGRTFRLVSNNIDDLNNIIGRNSIDNLVVSGIIKVSSIQNVPSDFVSHYVFKRHHPKKEIKNGKETFKYAEGSLDNCVPITIKSKDKKIKIFVKRIKILESENTNENFSTYGLGTTNGPLVPVF